jgi:hypothetical protein
MLQDYTYPEVNRRTTPDLFFKFLCGKAETGTTRFTVC